MFIQESSACSTFSACSAFSAVVLKRSNDFALRSTGEIAHERAALLAQRPFDAQSIAVELVDRRGDRHRVFGRRQRRIVGLLVATDCVLRGKAAGDNGGEFSGAQLPAARMLAAEFQREADRR